MDKETQNMSTKGCDAYKLVKEFHTKFGIEPQKGHPLMHTARIKHLVEELTEYINAVYKGDRADQLDALVDLVYVAIGTAYVDGFDFNGAFKHVHNCNMKKVRQATARSEWDVVKPEGWEAPKLDQFTR